jgi:hypothetical protein
MKNWKQSVLIGMVAIIVAGFCFVGCDDGNGKEEPKDQTATISLIGEPYTANVEGHLTDTEWNGVADKIETAFNGAYINGTFLVQVYIVGVFNDGLTVVVEKTSAYGKYKVAAGAFGTLYLNYGFLKSATNANLQDVIVSAVETMDSKTPKSE